MTIQRFWAFVVVFALAQLALATMALAQTEQAAKSDSQAKSESQAQTEQQAKPEQPAQSDPQAKPQQPAQPMHLRISSGVAEGLKIHNVTPRYPDEARQQRIEGDVLLQATIDTTGNLVNFKVVQGDPILVAAAVDAVKQWRYRPYILKGEPVPETTIRIQFHMTMALAQTEQAAKSDSQAQTEQQAKPEQPAQSAPQADPQQPTQPMRLRVSSGVAEGLKTHDVTPRYPDEARQQRIEGDVLLQATIDTNGNITKLKVVQGDPILVEAAIEAVKKWKYRPYLLKGEPVTVETTIRIQFHMR